MPPSWGDALGNMSLTRACRRPLAVVGALGVLIGSSVMAFAPAAAQEGPSSDSGSAEGGEQALVSIEVDVLRGDNVAVGDTLVEVRENVEQQKAVLASAQAAVATAQAALAAADAALADTQARLSAVNVDADRVVVDAFVNPPAESAFEALSAESLLEATVKQSILDRRADSDAARLAQFQELQARLESERAAREVAADAARAAENESQAALSDVEAAVSQQVAFAVEVQHRLDQNLAEAEVLENTDPALAEQIRAREAELAVALSALDAEAQAELARARAAELAEQAAVNRDISGIKPVPGGVTTVTCPTGGSVEVAGDIAGAVERLLADAFEAGITMCGYGYRDPADQIALRRSNCGSSDYAIYQAPSSYCSPPTAPPGASLHEQGLAIDFTYGGDSTIGSGSSAYGWLSDNAANYGLYNLPGEPWHWSVNGN
jgi:D-alanyl-D-alanine carboxypeptidase